MLISEINQTYENENLKEKKQFSEHRKTNVIKAQENFENT